MGKGEWDSPGRGREEVSSETRIGLATIQKQRAKQALSRSQGFLEGPVRWPGHGLGFITRVPGLRSEFHLPS